MALELTCQPHPSVRLNFQLDPAKHIFKIQPTDSIMALMELVEGRIEEISRETVAPIQFQIQVLWNTKEPRKACSPNDTVEQHFKNGEVCGIYGDAMPAKAQRVLPEDQKIPVTILTGFLGSGKTTLLNYILNEQRDKKIAVIENEVGEISIDDQLLKQNKMALAEKVLVMDNGCMCCTIRGDLVNGLREILEEVRAGKIDQIIIETTGMADPVPIVRTFMTSEEITGELRLDGVITLADAKHIVARLDDKVEEGKVNEAYQQVAFCDKMILNKLDLVSAEDAIAVKERLRSINSFAKILPAVKSRVKVTELTNLRAHDMTNFVNEDIEKEAEDIAYNGHEEGHGGGHGHEEGHGGGHGDGHDSGHGGHGGGHDDGHSSGHGSGHGTAHVDGHGHVIKKSRHDSRINSMSLVREGLILPQKLAKWMSDLGNLPEDKGTIFRIKAILAIKDHPFKHVFHAVMDVSDENDASAWEPGEKKISKIVFIGKGMDHQFLREGWESIFE